MGNDLNKNWRFLKDNVDQPQTVLQIDLSIASVKVTTFLALNKGQEVCHNFYWYIHPENVFMCVR